MTARDDEPAGGARTSGVPPSGSTTFVRAEDTPWQAMGPGVRRRILAFGPDIMMVRVDFETGAIGALHHHPHRQVTYVASGSFRVTVDGVMRLLGAGDSFFVAADLVHGVEAVGAGTLVDVFTPARRDFLHAGE